MRTKIGGRIQILVLCTVFLCADSPVIAQTQTGFAYFLQQLPGAPKSPADADLISASASAIENPSDIDKLERQVSEYLASMQGSAIGISSKADESLARATNNTTVSQRNEIDEVTTNEQPYAGYTNEHTSLEFPKTKNVPQATGYIAPYDSCRSIVKLVQQITTEYQRSFTDLERSYIYAINTVEDNAREAAKKEVCGGNSECLKRHRRDRNIGIVAAQHMRIDKGAEMLNAEIASLLPYLREFDRLMPRRLSSVSLRTTQRELNGYSSYVMNVILGAAERIKLNRIHIAECARLLQESR